MHIDHTSTPSGISGLVEALLKSELAEFVDCASSARTIIRLKDGSLFEISQSYLRSIPNLRDRDAHMTKAAWEQIKLSAESLNANLVGR